jgi:hypothetical protein
VSFDVFFPGFIGGESAGLGGAEMRAVLAPHVAKEDGSLLHLHWGADVYLHDDRDDG